MNRVPVISSNLSEVGYDPGTRTLEIAFNQGGVYRYSGVPPLIYEGLMSATSHGRFFDANIKKAGYTFRRIST
ncbi:KTSC domain-containing protein [Agreia sp. VKM Ac-1783]|uniref:KTSC domain-containing protein n=1 Tax=Agreia sp. VKM Ac-1783 TaxID=1938889 RepID=UPI000A2AE52D|nr:KTSC domain-containing protein [Agreia sp. VKM Ac-1783]SMQ74930.1 KTSC domain-containing protein [Agreia sp. VKM Ac-1783]